MAQFGILSVTHAIVVDEVTGQFVKEDDQYISICPELNIVSCGDSLERAFENLDEAVEVYLEALGNLGESERSRTLKEHGVDVKTVDADEDMGEGDVHLLTERPQTFHWMQRPAKHKVMT